VDHAEAEEGETRVALLEMVAVVRDANAAERLRSQSRSDRIPVGP
jgi:hypothetical protein